MSSDLLISARAISKIYSSAKSPIKILADALFGTELSSGEEFIVLKNIDLDVYKGETLGIMGRNGAGKSTLLAIIGGVIEPTSGFVHRSGKIATLLGLTAGFNPNFTGRENAYLFCTIQGLSKLEAKNQMDNIEKFSGLGRYFDMPLHTYSSGMQSRLAFSCAVHVNADLIIIDETLAVGDANFRLKCYERINFMKNSGQTFLLVSHNPNLIANFCTRAIVLEGGEKVFDGSTFESIEVYKKLRTDISETPKKLSPLKINKSSEADTNTVISLENLTIDNVTEGDQKLFVIKGELVAREELENIKISFSLRDTSGIVLCSYLAEKSDFLITNIHPKKSLTIEFKFFDYFLPGRYFVTFGINQAFADLNKQLALLQNIIYFDVEGDSVMGGIADFGMKVSEIDESTCS